MENVEQNVYEILQKLNVDYIKYEHEPLYTIEAAKELDKKMGFAICKNLFLSSRHIFFTFYGRQQKI
jgi:Ala-tRNA(Pro) deacylase